MMLSFTFNGQPITEDIKPDMTLYEFCRTHGAKSVKCGCETSNCGLCSVIVNGECVLSCSLIMGRLEGADIKTLEVMGDRQKLLAQCLAEEGSEQCGFCSPGLEMAVLALDEQQPHATEAEIRSALAGNLCRCTGYTSQMRGIRRFFARHLNGGVLPEREIRDDKTTRDDRAHSSITKPIVKKDSESLLAGRPVYTDDLVPQDALIVKILRSKYAHARIVSIDASKALALPGVHAVFTSEDTAHTRFTLAGQSYPEPSPYDTTLLDTTMRYIGDEVALVVADTERIASEALKLIKVKYEKLDAVIDMRDALDHEVIVHNEDDWKPGDGSTDEVKRNLVAHGEHVHGDLEAAFAEAEIVLERTYTTQAVRQAMMETFRSWAYTDEYGRICVVSSTQVPFHIRRQVALALDIPISSVRVIKPRVGGGFGAKQSGCCEAFAAFAAMKLNRPCSCTYTREESQCASNSRHEMELKVKIGAKKDGTIVAIDLYALSNAGAYGYHGSTTIGLTGAKTLSVYNRALASRFAYDVVYTNTMPGGAFRGYGATQGCFAVESIVNELADTLQMDPAELRLKNLVGLGEELYQLENEKLRDWRADECVERALEMIDWKHKPLFEDREDRLYGRGIALSLQGSGIAFVDIANADIRLEDNGFYILSIGATDVGTGADTILAQIAAEALGCDVDCVITKGVDTDSSPFDTGAYASSGTYVTGGAVLDAAQKLHTQIIEQVARWWKLDPAQIAFDGSYLYALVEGADNTHFDPQIHTQHISREAFANTTISAGLQQGMLTAHGTYSSPYSPPPFIVGIAEVEVEKATGVVHLIDFASVVDCGTVINPNLARVQTEGGLVQGIGMALTEEIVVDERGQLKNNSFMSYKIPSREDVCDIRVEFMPANEPTGPYGAKSIGEVVINTPSPAIASAIAHATQCYVRTLPITPQKVLGTMLQHEQESSLA